jgi:hypothetical protein
MSPEEIALTVQLLANDANKTAFTQAMDACGTQLAQEVLHLFDQRWGPAVAVTAQAAHAIERTRTGYELVGLMCPRVQPSAALLVAEPLVSGPRGVGLGGALLFAANLIQR